MSSRPWLCDAYLSSHVARYSASNRHGARDRLLMTRQIIGTLHYSKMTVSRQWSSIPHHRWLTVIMTSVHRTTCPPGDGDSLNCVYIITILTTVTQHTANTWPVSILWSKALCYILENKRNILSIRSGSPYWGWEASLLVSEGSKAWLGDAWLTLGRICLICRSSENRWDLHTPDSRLRHQAASPPCLCQHTLAPCSCSCFRVANSGSPAPHI